MDIFKGKQPVACLCRSDKPVELLIELSGRLSERDSVVLLLDDSPGVAGRLLPAYVNAQIRYADRLMRADTMQKEVLLFASKTMNIQKAVEAVGIRDHARFIVFATSPALLNRFIEESESERIEELKLSLDGAEAPSVAVTGIRPG